LDAILSRIMPRARVVNPDAARFGHLLRDLRLQRGWNLQRFARESKMTASYLGLLERGLNLPSLSAVITLAEVLGVDVGELVRHVAAGRKRSPPAVLPPLPQ
jgi:transcriptional regulator with XRE-family HTH domain